MRSAPSRSPRPAARHAGATLLAALCALALAAIAAAPAGAERAPRMSIKFSSPTARLAGPGALVRVRCAGVAAHSCVGTLSLRLRRSRAAAPFSIERGEEATVVVPLATETLARGGARSARAVARTMQSRGASVKTSRLLRIR